MTDANSNPFHHRPFPYLPDWFCGLSAHLTFYSAQRLDLFVQCVRLNWLSVGFRTHSKSLQFHFISFIMHMLTRRQTSQTTSLFTYIVINNTTVTSLCYEQRVNKRRSHVTTYFFSTQAINTTPNCWNHTVSHSLPIATHTVMSPSASKSLASDGAITVSLMTD